MNLLTFENPLFTISTPYVLKLQIKDEAMNLS